MSAILVCLKRSGMARVDEGSHLPPARLSTNGMSHHAVMYDAFIHPALRNAV